MFALAVALVSFAPALAPPSRAGGDPPAVVGLVPAHLDLEVDAASVRRLAVTFDRPMSTAGFSLCGGGPTFPPVKGKPRWESPTRLSFDVELAPGRDYQLSLNSATATNFRCANGVALAPTPWSFGTLPEKLPDASAQQALNRRTLERLRDLLDSAYAYRDLRVGDWDRLWSEHQPAIEDARTTRGWAAAVARMLAPTEDLHLYLRLDGRVFATGSRSIDSLFRAERLASYLDVEPMGERGLRGRTEDGIGYVMIPSWDQSSSFDAIETTLSELRGCKAIVVDVRPNSGGDELLARRVAAWFVEGSSTYAKHRFRSGRGAEGFGPVLDRSLEGNSDATKRIDVPVAVLTSRYVMSSNESFVLMMRQAKDCTVVGQRTFGSSGNPKPHDLGNGVTILVPSWQDLRLDGSCFEGEGLAPDVEVAATPDELASSDPILAKALAVLRAKLE